MMSSHDCPPTLVADAHRGIDPFASTGAKWRALLGISAHARVALVGPRFAELEADFSAAMGAVTTVGDTAELQGSAPFHFMLVDANPLPGAPLTLPSMLQSRVAEGGVVGVLHRVGALDRVRRALRPNRARPQARHDGALMLAFEAIAPARHAAPVEYWRASLRRHELSASAPRFQRALNALGLFAALHDQRLSLYSANGRLPLPLDADLTRRIEEETGPAMQIDTVRLRRRGAVVVTASGPRGRVIVRIAEDPAVISRIERNHAVLVRLHERASLPDGIRSRLPHPIGTADVRGVRVFVERGMEGTPLWKLRRGSPERQRAIAEAQAFSEALDLVTGREERVTPALFDLLLGRDLAILRSAFTHDAGAQAALQQLDSAFRRELMDSTVRVVLAHGDFALGNLLCHPRTGALQGVIDWDTWREPELEGVERDNVYVQSVMANASGSDAAALDVLRREPRDRRLRIALALLREPARAVAFPNEFASSMDRNRDVLMLAARLIGDPAGP